MKKIFKKLNIALITALIVAGGFGFLKVAEAANIGNTEGYAWGESIGWIRFDGLASTQDYGVTVPITDGADLSGYAWSENQGWIKFAGSCTEAGGCIDGGDTYAVVSTQTGCSAGDKCLSGYAWGESIGWIKFAATSTDYTNTSTSTYGVYIDSNDDWQGHAWSENMGWIKFSGSCTEAGGCINGGDTYGVGAISIASTTAGIKITATGGNIVIANNKIDITSTGGNEYRGVLAYGPNVTATIVGNEINVSGSANSHYGIEAKYADLTIIRNIISADDVDVAANLESFVVVTGQNRLTGSGLSFSTGFSSGLIETVNDYYDSVYNVGTFRDLTGARKYTCTSNESEGDTVYLSGTDTVARADADSISQIASIGFVVKKATTTECLVKSSGKIYSMTDDTGSALTPGAVYYVSDTAGKITTNPSAGKYAIQVGIAKSSSVLEIKTQENGAMSVFASVDTSALMIQQNGSGKIMSLANNSGEVLSVLGNGNIGIGTSSPLATLSIQGTAGTNPFSVSSSTGDSMVVVDEAGNVGIGSSSPTAKLVVSGATASGTNMFVVATTSGAVFTVDGGGNYSYDGSASSPAADYAEYFYTEDTDLVSGEAVCVDVTKENAVKRCQNASDGNLMGIVSTQPAIIGNAKKSNVGNKNYIIVGMLGQVPARVSTENGPIRPGDSLTSASSTLGYVMRANPGDPTVGVALEGLDNGTGIVKILISRRNKSLTVETVESQITDRIAEMEIEDEVQILITQAVDSLNLDSEIQSIVDAQIAMLDIDNRLTVGFDAIDGQIVNLSRSLDDVIGRLAIAEENISEILNSQSSMFNQISSLNDNILNNGNGLNIDSSGVLIIGRTETASTTASSTEIEIAKEIELHATDSIKLGNHLSHKATDGGSSTTTTVAIVEIDAMSDNEITAFVVNQSGNGDIADFRSEDVSVLNIENNGDVTIVGSMLVDGRIMICSGGVCGDKLNDNVDETMGDMGVEGRVVAGAFENICDDGYTWVDGSAKYGTLPGFCVSQNEASFMSYNIASSTPWTNITQGEAALACQEVGVGYHLISENEWLTIADSIIQTQDNDIDAKEGLQLATASTTASTTKYYLANGNVVYGLVGGVAEWTDRTISSSANVGPASNEWQEYYEVDMQDYNFMPPYYYDSENGIGRIKTGTSTSSSLRGFIRGESAVFDLDLSHSPVEATSTIGFRCAK